MEGVIETGQATTNRGSKWQDLLSAGIDVRLDNNPNQMHNKVMVIDGQIIALGSFNFTYSAETRNDENLLIVYRPQLAEIYLAEFERIFNQSSKSNDAIQAALIVGGIAIEVSGNFLPSARSASHQGSLIPASYQVRCIAAFQDFLKWWVSSDL